MPELAEVEYYRTRWNVGLGQPIVGIAVHGEKRIFRKVDVPALVSQMVDAVFLESQARGKQLLFRFSKNLWLGLHLGMTGKLSAETADYAAGKHDHLVLRQRDRSLLFHDPRLFGQIRFHQGADAPDWWRALPPPVDSPEFTAERMEQFLKRHSKLPIKAALLLQAGFPGIGNWMADEILWRAKVHPRYPAGRLAADAQRRLWREVRFVARKAITSIGQDFSDPPRGWLFHERWGKGGRCPIHGNTLERRTIGGRTSAWCKTCQPEASGARLRARKASV